MLNISPEERLEKIEQYEHHSSKMFKICVIAAMGQAKTADEWRALCKKVELEAISKYEDDPFLAGIISLGMAKFLKGMFAENLMGKTDE